MTEPRTPRTYLPDGIQLELPFMNEPEPKLEPEPEPVPQREEE